MGLNRAAGPSDNAGEGRAFPRGKPLLAVGRSGTVPVSRGSLRDVETPDLWRRRPLIEGPGHPGLLGHLAVTSPEVQKLLTRLDSEGL